MKFLSEMMSKRKTAEEAELPLDAPLDADGGDAGDFPLPDFAAVAGDSLNPVPSASAQDESGPSAEAPAPRFQADDGSYDWDIGGLDLSDEDDNAIETDTRDEGAIEMTADQGEDNRSEGEMMDKYEDENETPADDAKALAAQALASFAADLSSGQKMSWDDEVDVEDEGEPEAAASLDDAEETFDEDAAEPDPFDEAEPALAAALDRLPEPTGDGMDETMDEDDDALEMEAPEPQAAPDAWDDAPKPDARNLMARSVQEKMAAMRAQASQMPAPEMTDDADDAGFAPVRPAQPGFGGDGIAGQGDDEPLEVASLSPLAALRAQREAALAASRAAAPEAPAMEEETAHEMDEAAAEMDAADEMEMTEAQDLDTWAPEPTPRPMPEAAPAAEAPRTMPAPHMAPPMAAEEPQPVRPALRSTTPAAPPAAAEDDMPELAPSPRRAGRVKTRLLGFHKAEETDDPIQAAQEVKSAEPTFPVGWLLVVKGPGRGTCFNLSTGASKIGRGEDQAVRLDFGDTSISRDNHAVVAYDDEQKQFFIGHGGKANLVRLNDMPILSTETLNDGDVIRIGETVLLFVALCSDAFSWTDGPFAESTHAAE